VQWLDVVELAFIEAIGDAQASLSFSFLSLSISISSTFFFSFLIHLLCQDLFRQPTLFLHRRAVVVQWLDVVELAFVEAIGDARDGGVEIACVIDVQVVSRVADLNK
jgi:hypothetical protein